MNEFYLKVPGDMVNWMDKDKHSIMIGNNLKTRNRIGKYVQEFIEDIFWVVNHTDMENNNIPIARINS